MAIFEKINSLTGRFIDTSEHSQNLASCLMLVGAFVLLVALLSLSLDLYQGVRLYVAAQCGCCRANLADRYGQWAVVTGATDGIGASVAEELASRGMSILAVSRNSNKLAATKAKLEAIPNVGLVETIQIDLSDSSAENFDRAKRLIDPDNRNIGILINNAGTFTNEFKRINKFDMTELLQTANLNMLAPVYMTRMLMPGMLTRGRGLIVNVSSLLGSTIMPYMSLYSATKSFLDVFTRQLQLEYASHPIDVVLLTPGFVSTNHFNHMSALPTSYNPLNPTPSQYARSVVSAISAVRCKEFSGTIGHGILRYSMIITKLFGIATFATSLTMRVSARNYDVSPAPKRKRLTTKPDELGTQTIVSVVTKDLPADPMTN